MTTGEPMTYACFYDFYDGPEYRQDQLALYRRLAAEAGPDVLELGCGTGIIAIDLARAGCRVTGLDIDPDMLAVAAGKLAREDSELQSRVHLVEANMAAFKLRRSFDMVCIAGNTFGLLTAQADQRGCLRSALAHLRPGGLLVIEERRLTAERLLALGQQRNVLTVHAAGVNPATGLYTTFCWITQHVDLSTQTITSRRWIDETQPDGSLRRYVPRDGGLHRSHYFAPAELRLLIEQAGFIVRDAQGMTFVAHKPRPAAECSKPTQASIQRGL